MMHSVRMKLVALTSLIFALISLFIYWYFPRQLERKATDAITERARSMATMMAYNVSVAIEDEDRPTVCAVVIGAKQNPDLDYVMVFDSAGNVVATFDSVRALAASYADADFADRISEDGLTYQTAMPIALHGKLLGRIYLGLSLRTVHEEIARTRSTIALVSLTICGVGVALVVLISTLITTPLSRMMKVVEKIAQGDWTQRVKINATDEFGRLAAGFNSMVDSLEMAYDDLRKSEKNYRDLFESNPHPMWVHDIDTLRILSVNDAAVESYGYVADEFLAMTINDIIVHPVESDMLKLRSRIGNLYRSTGWRHAKKDGTLIDVEMSSHPLPLAGGRKARLVLINDITKHLHAERLLRESEERYRDLFESANDLILSVGPDCTFQFANRAFAETLGHDPANIPRLHLFDIIKQQELPHFKMLFRNVAKGKPLERIQTCFVAKDGREVVVEGDLNCRFVEGELVAIRGIFRNVTERKQAEAALLEEKTRFDQLLDNAPIGIVLTDERERIVRTNRTFEQMFGYTLPEIAGKSINHTVIPEEFLGEGDSFSERILRGESIHVEVVRKRQDGTLMNVELYGVPIIVNGAPLGMFAMYVDISERKRAEEALSTERNTLRTLIDNLPDRIYVKDREGRFLVSNSAHAKTLGVENPDEAIGKTDFDFGPSEVAARTHDDDRVVMTSGKLSNREEPGVSPAGEQVWLATTKVPLRDTNGVVNGIVCISRDITELKRNEAHQADLVRELESVNKDLNDFAYIISHDLKAPLRAIGSLVDWLASDYQEALGEEGRELLTMLLGRTKRLHDLIEGVLRYSRIGSVRETGTKVPLATLVPDIVEMIQPPKHIEIVIADPLPTIVAETTRIQQVFQNLLTNAIKFMDKPKGRIVIGCERLDKFWKFSVADNGPGIEEKHFAKIFQIFQTLHARDEFESTGIGLTIVKKVVELYGGKVWLESEVGVGTTFYFTLPVETFEETSAGTMNILQFPRQHQQMETVEESSSSSNGGM